MYMVKCPGIPRIIVKIAPKTVQKQFNHEVCDFGSPKTDSDIENAAKIQLLRLKTVKTQLFPSVGSQKKPGSCKNDSTNTLFPFLT